jgi:hypothetical protein
LNINVWIRTICTFSIDGWVSKWINTGSGWQLNDNWKPPIAISHWNDSGNFDTGVRIVDVSGDGLPDFLKFVETVN